MADSDVRVPRRTTGTMPHYWLARALGLSAVTACGLDLAGEQMVVAPDPFAMDGSAAGGSEFDVDRDPAGEGGTGADGPALDGEPALGAGSGAEKSEAQAPFDASMRDPPTGFPPEAGAEGATACDIVSECCSGLADAASPATLVCLAGAAQASGGDAGTCESILAIFTNAGICPQRSSDGGPGP